MNWDVACALECLACFKSLIESGYFEQKPGARKQIAALNVINQSNYGAENRSSRRYLRLRGNANYSGFLCQSSKLPSHRSVASLIGTFIWKYPAPGSMFDHDWEPFFPLPLLARLIDVRSPFSMWSELQFDFKVSCRSGLNNSSAEGWTGEENLSVSRAFHGENISSSSTSFPLTDPIVLSKHKSLDKLKTRVWWINSQHRLRKLDELEENVSKMETEFMAERANVHTCGTTNCSMQLDFNEKDVTSTGLRRGSLPSYRLSLAFYSPSGCRVESFGTALSASSLVCAFKVKQKEEEKEFKAFNQSHRGAKFSTHEKRNFSPRNSLTRAKRRSLLSSASAYIKYPPRGEAKSQFGKVMKCPRWERKWQIEIAFFQLLGCLRIMFRMSLQFSVCHFKTREAACFASLSFRSLLSPGLFCRSSTLFSASSSSQHERRLVQAGRINEKSSFGVAKIDRF